MSEGDNRLREVRLPESPAYAAAHCNPVSYTHRGLIMGADGGIGSTYNIMPDIYKKIYIAYLQSNIEEAQRWQFWADAVIGILLKFGQIQSMKYLFCRKGIDIGKAEKPGAELSQAEGKALMKELKIIGYFHEYPELE